MTPLAQAVEKAGISLSELARQLGTSRQNVSRWASGAVPLPRDRAVRVAEILGVPAHVLILGGEMHSGSDVLLALTAKEAPQMTGYRVEPNAVFEGGDVRLPAVGQMLRDIQELGATVGGFGDDESAFEMNGQVVDLVPRPPGLAHRKDVFALRVSNNSMWPKFKDGERVYVERRKPAIGDDVVIELHPAEEGQPGKSFIKNLISRSSALIIVEQYNPFGRLEFDSREVRQVFRVIPWQEVAGLA
ncbi:MULTISPECIES: helix-turn-helix domain-containing protein [unclassified Bosea (in: a-proteobacteria)]|uniref:LexA family transcriptional regulator n=1 Tax=unclassified Bosea (in: a-proteobacteria) TaxID=2653178 RepID=UPI00135B03E9|nr:MULTISPECIES: helix-turn-helix domain-containing protein [unclassified Bosea (in: a-proteobacteria)]